MLTYKETYKKILLQIKQDIGGVIEGEVIDAVSVAMKPILKEIREGHDRLQGIDSDLSRDRQDLGDINVRLTTVERELMEIRKSLTSNADRVNDKVSATIDPLQGSVDKLTTQIEKKKMVVLTEGLRLPSEAKVRRFIGITLLVGAVVGAAIIAYLAL